MDERTIDVYVCRCVSTIYDVPMFDTDCLGATLVIAFRYSVFRGLDMLRYEI